MAIDPQDNVCVTGYTRQFDYEYYQRSPFPVTENAYDQDFGQQGQHKAFVSKLNNDLTELLASTLLGGTQTGSDSRDKDESYCIAIDANGAIYIGGQAQNRNFPTTLDCVDPIVSGDREAFVAKFDSNLEHLLASTFLGGMENEQVTAIALDKFGDIFAGGWTDSVDFPLKAGGYNTEYSGTAEDSFVVKLNNTMTELKASTLLRQTANLGIGDEVISGLMLSSDEKTVFVVGRTESKSFPTTLGCFDDTFNDKKENVGALDGRNLRDADSGDGFFSTFNSELTELTYSTFLGGGDLDYIDALLANGDDVLVAGETFADFPLTEPYDFHKVHTRGFISRFSSDETPSNPDDNDNNDVNSRGGGGGGGCFLQSLLGDL